MIKIVNIEEQRKRIRDQYMAEILHAHGVLDDETRRLIEALHKLIEETPVADWGKLAAVFQLLIEQLAATEDEAEREANVKAIAKLLSTDIVEATREAFAQMK